METIHPFLLILIYLYAFWYLFVGSMGIYRAHLQKKLKGLNFVLSAPAIVVAYVVDVIANWTIAVFLFAELPKEFLVTTRLKRFIAGGEAEYGYRYTIAQYLCDKVLDIFDPTGNHC
jgi:hypothetical protein